MKKIYFALATLMTAMTVGCNKNVQIEEINRVEDSVLSFTIGEAPVTKATTEATTAEETMKYLHVFVFNNETTSAAYKQLEAYAYYTPNATSQSGSVTVSRGQKKVVFTANMPASFANGIRTIDDYNDVAWAFASNATTRDAFVMRAVADVNVDATDKNLGSITMKRIVSRVQVKEVKNSLPLSYGAITLNGIYLHNVTRTLGNTSWAAASYWRSGPSSTRSADIATVNALVNQGATGSIANAASWTEPAAGYYLYGFPNNAPEAGSEMALDYITKVVVDVTINGVTYYYPLGIKNMGENLAYLINRIELKRLGSGSPDEYVSTATASFSVTVLDWTDGSIVGSYNSETTPGSGIFTF
ncbi:MAG: hypothetical protein IJ687_06050 [Bacteroidales bacterium]|nr:hypothetical protein [Bacteroidales bacterium]